MRLIIKLWVSVICLIACSISVCYASNVKDIDSNSFYYYKGEKVPLKAIENANNTADVNISNSDEYPLYITIKNGKISRRYTNQEVNNISAVQRIGLMEQSKFYKIRQYLSEKNDTIEITPIIYVKIADYDVAKTCIEKVCEMYDLSVCGQINEMPEWYILQVNNPDQDPLEISNKICESGMFLSVSSDFLNMIKLNASYDEYTDNQWAICNDYKTDINATEAWNIATGKGVKIAIYDQPLEYMGKYHKDFADNISSLHYTVKDYDTQKTYMHGINCAGIAAAVRNNGIGISGVAPDAEIVPITLVHDRATDSLNVNDYVDGFIWAKNNVDVISCSFSFTCVSETVDDAIYQAYKKGRNGKGCVIVIASGNDNNVYVDYPSNLGYHVLSVGGYAIESSKNFIYNHGIGLDVVAPAYHILTTEVGDSYRYMDGTSASTPQAAAVAALMLEVNPDLTAIQVLDIIKGRTVEKCAAKYDTKPFLHTIKQSSNVKLDAAGCVKRALDWKLYSDYYKNN